MNAKNNKTGEIVTNFTIMTKKGDMARYVDSNGHTHVDIISDDEWTIINEPENVNFDWTLFRIETARDIMASMVSNDGYFLNTPNKDIARQSIALADELIRQLKEKQ